MPRDTSIRPILASFHTYPVDNPMHQDAPPVAPPFFTFSREPGAGAATVARKLVDALNANAGAPLWTCWDRELIEKIATDRKLSKQLIMELEEREHSWLSEFLDSLNFSDSQEEMNANQVYAEMRKTIRALATRGHVVIVGRGGVFITRDMPGGIHVRLMAPLQYRIANMAANDNLSTDKAAKRIRELEHNRKTFFKKFWPDETISPELFTLTINAAHVDPDATVSMLEALLRARRRAVKASRS